MGLVKYVMAFKMSIQNAMEYRINFLFGLLYALLPIIIQYFLWKAVYEHADSQIVYGYTYQQMLIYAVMAGIISKLIISGVEFEISEEIKSGVLNKFLIKPLHYLPYRIAVFLGGKVIFFCVTFLLVLLSKFILTHYFQMDITLARFGTFMLALLLAIVLNFLLYYCISAIAFWVDEVWHFFYATSFVMTILSGGVFPLDLFGQTFINIMNYLPFKYVIFFPINTFNGRLDFTAIWSGIGIQILWIVVMIIVSKWIWGRGYRKYTAVGG